MLSLAEIRQRLLDQENKNSNKTSGGDSTLFPFWNMEEGQTTIVRYLHDGDSSNPYFWRERQMIKIPFSGVKGGEETKPVSVTVPCVEMWGQKCPIHDEIRPWFKDPAMETLARKYWKKRSYIFQAFIVDTPMKEETPPENPIRRLVINTTLFNIIKTALMDPDFPELPTHYDKGTDFKIIKTQKGQYADYATSNWARRERSLNQQERDAIDKYGLFNLNDFMPKQPNEKELQAIFDMFEASVDGQLYDPERFAEFYRPMGVQFDGARSSGEVNEDEPETAQVRKPAARPAPQPEHKPEPVAEHRIEEPTSSKPSAESILAAIRNRKAQG
jgi:hypothetical protein